MALWAKSGWPVQPRQLRHRHHRAVQRRRLGPPPWFVYEVKPRTATAVGTAEETPGSTLAVLKVGAIALVLVAVIATTRCRSNNQGRFCDAGSDCPSRRAGLTLHDLPHCTCVTFAVHCAPRSLRFSRWLAGVIQPAWSQLGWRCRRRRRRGGRRTSEAALGVESISDAPRRARRGSPRW